MATEDDAEDPRELVIERVIAAIPAAVYRAWTEPDQLRQWFAPRPWTVERAHLDVRPGGHCDILMRGPDGEESAAPGVFLDVVPNERLVFTDAYVGDWRPSEQPFMTVVLTFENAGGRTRYRARVRHWTLADRERHEAMGFHDGWSRATDQLCELVERRPS